MGLPAHHARLLEDRSTAMVPICLACGPPTEVIASEKEPQEDKRSEDDVQPHSAVGSPRSPQTDGCRHWGVAMQQAWYRSSFKRSGCPEFLDAGRFCR